MPYRDVVIMLSRPLGDGGSHRTPGLLPPSVAVVSLE